MKNNPIRRAFLRLSANARKRRAATFRRLFRIDRSTRVLDLGSEDGSNIAQVLDGSSYSPENVYIADIDPAAIRAGNEKFGFQPILLDESGRLPFDQNFFDLVYCSSVIEHVTLPKAKLWSVTGETEFRSMSLETQAKFAREIQRVGRQYFVQTPCASFPIESHTWLPLVGYFPRPILLRVMKLSNRYWVKAAAPDFNLLSKQDMQDLFPSATIIEEKFAGLTKSIMALRSDMLPE